MRAAVLNATLQFLVIYRFKIQKRGLGKKRCGCQEGFHLRLGFEILFWGFSNQSGLSHPTSEEGVDDKWVMWESCEINSKGSWCGKTDMEILFIF